MFSERQLHELHMRSIERPIPDVKMDNRTVNAFLHSQRHTVLRLNIGGQFWVSVFSKSGVVVAVTVNSNYADFRIVNLFERMIIDVDMPLRRGGIYYELPQLSILELLESVDRYGDLVEAYSVVNSHNFHHIDNDMYARQLRYCDRHDDFVHNLFDVARHGVAQVIGF